MTVTITERYTLSPKHRILTVDFFGTPITTTVTSTASVVRKWIRKTLHARRRHLGQLVVGVGVQWFPNSTGAATLQLCVGRRCLIFQLIHSDTVPILLRRFLVNPNNTFVGIWTHSDAIRLFNSKHRLEMHKLLDLRYCALSRNGERLIQASFETIVSEWFGIEGVRLEKWISRSEWDDFRLSDEQVLQACIDAHVSFEIGKRLRAWEIEI